MADATFTSEKDINAPSGYDVYSGADIQAIVHIPPDFLNKNAPTNESDIDYYESFYRARGIDLPKGFFDESRAIDRVSKPAVLGDIQTLSYSVYREKYPVRTIGQGYPKGFTRGPRTISGTMIFTMFNKQVLYDLLSRITPDTSSDLSTPLIDQLPRFDVTITFANEYGSASTLVIYGVEIISEGITMSIEDFFTENVVQYIATDIRPMLPDTETSKRIQTEISLSATDLVMKRRDEERMKGYLKEGLEFSKMR